MPVLCTHCQKTCLNLKRCSVCKTVAYCSTKCQKLSWKGGHKTLCKKPVRLADFLDHTDDALQSHIEQLLYMTRHIETLLHRKSPEEQCEVLYTIVSGLRHQMVGGGTYAYTSDAIPLLKMRADILGSCMRFRDQGDDTNIIADLYSSLDDDSSAIVYFERARRIGEAHGFFRVECLACRGLGDVFV